MKHQKLLIIASQLGMGGSERQLFYLLRALQHKETEMMVLNLSGGGGFYWQKRLSDLGIHVHKIDTQNQLNRAWRIRQVAQQWQADVVQSFNYHTNGYAALAAVPGQARVVGGMRNLPTEDYLTQVPYIWQWLCLKGVQSLVCNSSAARQMLLARDVPEKKIKVIPNGVEVPGRKELAHLRLRGEEKLQKKADELLVGFVGYLGRQKNIPLLLNAVASILPQYPELRLVIVGDGPLRTELELESERLGLTNVTRFLGQIPLAEKLMPAFDILCLPSHFEGMPNVAMEAGAAGIPVVASKVADLPVLIKHGKTGLLFPPSDLDCFASQLKALLEDKQLRHTLGLGARKHMRRNFSIMKMVKEYERVYQVRK